MSAADRMVVRTRSGAYRSLPRRTALGLLAAGRVTLDAAPVTPQAAPVTPQAAPVTDVEASTVPPTPDARHMATQPDVVNVEDRAGDRAGLEFLEELPDGVETDGVPTVEAVELPPEPKQTARRSEWADYADSLGVQVTSTMTKREIQQAAEEAATSLANLPQPALTGGRLDTPEDEPVTDGSVTDDEDSRTR